MAQTSVTGLGYLELGVSSLDDWQAYAESVLGVAANRVGERLFLRYDSDCWRLQLVETDEDDIRVAGFRVSSDEDMDAIRQQVESLGIAVSDASPELASARGVSRLMQCTDPAGVGIELYLGDRSVSEAFESPRGVSGFVTGDQELGHIVLMTGEVEKEEQFLREGLGFLLSDHIMIGPEDGQIPLTFLHCNPRHHTVALAPFAAPKRLNHIMLQVDDIDEVGRGLDIAKASGTRISSGFGKHTNDEMISFYMQTPSGFDIEYGYGGLEIDDSTWVPGTHYATSYWGHKGDLVPE